MNISKELDDYIAKEGKGNVRDALNVALARLKILELDKQEMDKQQCQEEEKQPQ
jgi:hypothetical protein